MRLRLMVAALLAAGLSSPAAAIGLYEVWQAALAHDPSVAVARAGGEAGQARRQQADALWRPVVAIEGGVAWAGLESATRGAQVIMQGQPQTGVGFNTSVTSGASTRVAIAVRQPIWSAERNAQARQLQIDADVSGIVRTQAEQALMLQSAEHYFAVGLLDRRLQLLLRQQHAVDQMLVEAKDRFRAGDRPVLEVHEAHARAEALGAQRIALETELELARSALAVFSGLRPEPAAFTLPSRVSADTEVGELTSWTRRAEQANATLRQTEARLASALQEIEKTRGALSPVLDVVAQAGRDRLSGSGEFGDAGQTLTQRAIGLQLSVPLYTGGMRDARQAEAHALAEQARAELARARLQVGQQVKAVWLGLKQGAAQLDALEAAAAASEARLDATRVGREAGDRTMLDVLNAENDAAAAILAASQARVNLLLGHLRLALLAGELHEDLLVRADRLTADNH